MASTEDFFAHLRTELDGIRASGLYKAERIIATQMSEGGHAIPRFEGLAVGNPAGQRARRVDHRAGAQRRARGHVGEVRPEAAVRRGAAHGVAGGTGLREKQIPSALQLCVRRQGLRPASADI